MNDVAGTPKKSRKWLWIVLGVVALLIVIGMAAGDPPASSEAANAAADPAEPPVEVTARELFSAYEANEASAKMKYGDKSLLVSGKIADITLDFMDNPVIGLKTGNQFMSAQASLIEADQPKAADLSKGQDIKLLCGEVTEVAGTPMLSDCAIQ